MRFDFLLFSVDLTTFAGRGRCVEFVGGLECLDDSVTEETSVRAAFNDKLLVLLGRVVTSDCCNGFGKIGRGTMDTRVA